MEAFVLEAKENLNDEIPRQRFLEHCEKLVSYSIYIPSNECSSLLSKTTPRIGIGYPVHDLWCWHGDPPLITGSRTAIDDSRKVAAAEDFKSNLWFKGQ